MSLLTGGEMKLLSWERIRMVFQEQDEKGQHDPMFRMEALCKEQALETLQEVIDWGNKPCPHGKQTLTRKHECSKCWAGLVKELGE